MTGEEFMFLSKTASLDNEAKNQDTPSQSNSEKKYVYGIDGIAKIFGCNRPTASRIKKSGRINAANLTSPTSSWMRQAGMDPIVGAAD